MQETVYPPPTLLHLRLGGDSNPASDERTADEHGEDVDSARRDADTHSKEYVYPFLLAVL